MEALHAQLLSEARGLNFSLSLHLCPYLVCANSAFVQVHLMRFLSLSLIQSFCIHELWCHMALVLLIWASTQESLSLRVCRHLRHIPACASTQSDQRLCYSLIGKYHILTCYECNFNFLASLCSWRDWFLSFALSETSKTDFVESRPI